MRSLYLSLFAAAGLAAVAAPSAEAMQPGCGAALRAEADAESFAADGERLARETATNFTAAATQLCGSGGLRAADLAAFTRLLVRNTEGASEPIVYDDAEQGPDTLILEYGFTPAAPSQAAIGRAIRCWRQPETTGCDQGGDL